MKQQLAQPKRAAPLPDPTEGMPAVAAGESATAHLLLAVCRRLDKLCGLEARLEKLEGKNGR